MKIRRCWMIGWIVLLGAFAASCAQAQAPTLVASYPKDSSGGNPPRVFVDGPVVVETVSLTLAVSDPDGAAEETARWAYEYGGYESGRYAWQAGDGRIVSQEIFLPLNRSDAFHERLLQMGWKENESITRHTDAGYGHLESWAQFSIQYRTRPEAGWNHPHGEDFLRWVCGYFEGAAVFLSQLAVSLLLAAAIVIPGVFIIVGGITTIRWLFRR
jgi:hypothetical protein